MPEYSKADKAMAIIIAGNGDSTIKQEQLDSVVGQLQAAKDFETACAFQSLYAGNLSAYNKTLEQHGIVKVTRSVPAAIIRLQAALADVKAEIAKATASQKK